MLVLKADGVNLARVDAPKPSIWSSFSNITKTTKVALGVFTVGVVVAASAISFGAIPLITGSAVALAGVGIYAYGKISQAIERKSLVKPILKAPAKDFDFMYIAPQPKSNNNNAAPAAPVAAPPKQMLVSKQVPASKVAPIRPSNDKENVAPQSQGGNIFPNRVVRLGKTVSSKVSRQPVLAN